MRVEMVNISDTKISFVRDNCTLSFHCLCLGKNDASVAGGIVRAREVFKGAAKPCGEWGEDAFPPKKCPGKEPRYQPQLL